MEKQTTHKQLSELFEQWRETFIIELNLCSTIQDIIRVLPPYMNFDETRFANLDIDEVKEYLIKTQYKTMQRNLSDYKQIEEDIISLRIK